MKKMIKKLGACLLAVTMVLLCATVTPVQAKSTAKYVTRAEVLSQVEKLIGATAQSADIKKVKDVKKKDSYYKTMSVALQAGLVEPNTKTQKLYPTKQATWNYVAGVVATVTETDKASVLGNRKAGAKLTKAQLTAYLNKKFPNVVKKSTATVNEGNVVINKPNVTLKNATVTGDLVIGDGVADKEVTLENVIVKGKTIVRGGGVNSIILKGTTTLSTVVIRQVNNAVSLKVQDDANVSMVYINDGSNDVKIVGNVGSLTIQGSNLNVDLAGASVKELTVAKKAANASVNIGEKSSVGSVNLNAEGAKLTGNGKVETINVNANKTTVTAKADTVNVKDGVEKPVTDESSLSEQPTKPDEATGSGSAGGSGSSGNSGSTGDSGNTGDNGNTETPGTPETPLNELDKAFADGYPKVEMDKESAIVTVAYKLKEGVASATSPAAIYNVVSTYNTSWDADVQAVLHGHLGKNEDRVSASLADFLWIMDSDEHILTYDSTMLSTNHHEGLVLYSVIEQDGKTSAVPNKVQFDADTTDSFIDSQPPYLSEIYQNKAGNKVYLYFGERLDVNSVPDPSCFTVSSEKNISVKNVSVQDYTQNDEHFGHFVELTLSEGLPEEGRSTISYTKPDKNALKDQANIPNEVENFSNRTIERITNQISVAYYSADGKYLSMEVPCRPLGMNTVRNNLLLEIDGVQYELDSLNCMYSYYINQMTITVKNLQLTGETHNIALKSKDGSELRNFAFDDFEDVTVQQAVCVEDPEIKSATYNAEEGTLKVTLSQYDHTGSYVACCFIMSVDGKEYHMRGHWSWDWENMDSRLVFDQEQMKHMNLIDAKDIKIKYVKPEHDDRGICSYAGKPMESTDYISVTIEE